MGKLNTSAPDTASKVVAGTFSAAGTSAVTAFRGAFNVTAWGSFQGAIQLERSFDGGITWITCRRNSDAPLIGYTGGITALSASDVWQEIEPDVLYRMNATSIASGSVAYRLSQ